MNEANRIENFSNENEVRERIKELKAKGVNERDIYVIADSEDSFVKRENPEVNYKNAEGSFGDKFASLLSGEEPEEKALDRFDLREADKNKYVQDLKNGHILLYAEGAAYEESLASSSTSSTETPTDKDRTEPTTSVNPGADLGAPGTTDSRDTRTPAAGAGGIKNDDTYADEVYAEDVVRDEDFPDRNARSQPESPGTDQDFAAKEDVVRDEDFPDRNARSQPEPPGTDQDFAPNTTNKANLTDEEKERMELHEEKLDVDKQRKQAGEVEVNKHTVKDKEEFDVPVTHEEVTVERRPVNEERKQEGTGFDKKGGVYEDDESIRVPVHEEEVEVNKKDVVKEEIVVNKKEKKDNVHVEEDVRREEADISDSTTDLPPERDRTRDDNRDR